MQQSSLCNSSLGKKQAYPWDWFCSRACTHLVCNAKMLSDNSQYFELYDVNCYILLHAIIIMVAICLIKDIAVRITHMKEVTILMKSELASAWSNSTAYIIPPALKDCYERWISKPLAK